MKPQCHGQPAQHTDDADFMDQLGARQTQTGRQQNNRQHKGADDRQASQRKQNHIRSRVVIPNRPSPNLSVSAVKRQRASREGNASGSAFSTGTWS